MHEQQIDEFFSGAPPSLDVARIRGEWAALQAPYQVDARELPLPVWARRRYSDSGPEAWGQLRSILPSLPAERPLCIYLHVPFCASKCAFCDCYSFRLGDHQARHIDGYVDALLREMRLWSAQGNLRGRPVSSVHLGGGTPSFLGAAPFRRLIESCAALFNTGPQTEWALESTVSELTPELAGCLHELGFRRLHLGVQTLEDGVRRAIGRRSTAAQVLDAVARARGLGWIVSVDLICGLPGQTLAGLLESIELLARAGAHGVSLYELLIYRQNRRWAESCGLAGRGHLESYLLFQAGAGLLEQLGYRKNLFNHFALPQDRNVYFTYPTRGEDLLALGAIADGSFGDYHYRHPIYKRYRAACADDFPGLEGGLRRSERESALYRLTAAVLAGAIPPALEAQLGALHDERGRPLAETWRALQLVSQAAGGGLDLTASGSWFAGNMVAEIIRADSSKPRIS